MSGRKHRRNPDLDTRLDVERLQAEVSREIDTWQSAEKRRQDEWLKVDHLPNRLASAYMSAHGRRRIRNRPEMATCQMPECSKPSIDLLGKWLGICAWHGLDVVAYFDVTQFEYEQRDELKEQLLARRQYLRSQKEAHEEQAAARRRMAEGWIYYLLVADKVKIGYTKDVKRRLRSYPPGSPLLALHPGTKQLETDMHAKFAGSKAAGREWFLDTPELREHVKEVIAQFGEPDRARYEHHGTGRNKSRLKAT